MVNAEVESNFPESARENKHKEHRVHNGSFRVYLSTEDEDNKTPVTIQMLTQNDYADGWNQVVPKAKKFIKKFVDTEGNQQIRHFTNAHRMKINLAQLPEHLWHRMQYFNENTKIVNNGYHYYIVEATNVDDEIRELVNILNSSFQSEYKERVHELLTILKDNDVYGWVVIRAKSMYK